MHKNSPNYLYDSLTRAPEDPAEALEQRDVGIQYQARKSRGSERIRSAPCGPYIYGKHCPRNGLTGLQAESRRHPTRS